MCARAVNAMPNMKEKKVGKIPAKKNPFKPFKEYQKEFEKAKDAKTLAQVLEDNGAPISCTSSFASDLSVIEPFTHCELQKC